MMTTPTCTRCGDTRQIAVQAGETCPACGGAGEYDYDYGSRVEKAACLVCGGNGTMDRTGEITCPACQTFGRPS